MKQLLLLLFIPALQTFSVHASAKQPIDTALNQPAPAFQLKDINGKTVSLADYKGKTLVIDFWATWCVPCRNSFPAVKMVMEKYQDDPDVKFLFIDTRETAANYKELVRKFLADNHYAFHTVFDEKSDDGKMDVNFKKYVMPGIPAKYFIDGNGVIKYQSLGYNTALTTEQTALEIEETIEKVKAGK
ncbi:MAG: TlpA family protein disulfide reductase [Bacteroidota bacterium]|nr:TlpA family protein disulfide reductase [Bacteroidota bacterium]